MVIDQLVLPMQCCKMALSFISQHTFGRAFGQEEVSGSHPAKILGPPYIEMLPSTANLVRYARKQHVPAPLVPLPIIDVPFSCIAMDIVGPLPHSRMGNKYILVICDYATRYPEAIPLHSIDASHVAEELLKLFTRIGVPIGKSLLTKGQISHPSY